MQALHQFFGRIGFVGSFFAWLAIIYLMIGVIWLIFSGIEWILEKLDRIELGRDEL